VNSNFPLLILKSLHEFAKWSAMIEARPVALGFAAAVEVAFTATGAEGAADTNRGI
jgi:hypothetical protein